MEVKKITKWLTPFLTLLWSKHSYIIMCSCYGRHTPELWLNGFVLLVNQSPEAAKQVQTEYKIELQIYYGTVESISVPVGF